MRVKHDRLHMDYPVTQRSTVYSRCRVCGVGDTNLQIVEDEVMREIKFRAWDKEDFKIRKVLGMSFQHESISVKLNDEEYLQDDASRFELMQYTGLKDLNGTEIYEGDIIAQRIKNNEYMNIKEVKFGYFEDSVDYYNYDGVGFYAVGNDGEENGELSYMIEIADYEVIGNIYENPELLGDIQ